MLEPHNGHDYSTFLLEVYLPYDPVCQWVVLLVNRSGGRSLCWLFVGRLVIISYNGGKLDFHAPIGALFPPRPSSNPARSKLGMMLSNYMILSHFLLVVFNMADIVKVYLLEHNS